MIGKGNLHEDLKNSSDTIEVSKDKIVKNLSRRRNFKKSRVFPWFSLTLILVYITVYFICAYGHDSITDLALTDINLIEVSTGNEILNGKFLSIVFNIFVHRNIWDLINTVFIIVFCGFFIEKYVNRKVILVCYLLSVVLFSNVYLFLYPDVVYCGSFTIVSFLIGMCIYFSYRFKRFIVNMDMYIYIALTFIGFFVAYMVYFYNILQFILSYLVGVFVIFILDTKALRE